MTTLTLHTLPVASPTEVPLQVNKAARLGLIRALKLLNLHTQTHACARMHAHTSVTIRVVASRQGGVTFDYHKQKERQAHDKKTTLLLAEPSFHPQSIKCALQHSVSAVPIPRA